MGIQRDSLDNSTFSSSKYDVFLSFRGEDQTHKKFTDHLYTALIREGITVFRDDQELVRGKTILPIILNTIEESRLSIVVFSRNYAFSTRCLDDLVKIVECMNTRGQMVIPFFYDIDPSMVRKQTGEFQEAFAKHEEIFKENVEMVQTWRKALTEVANLSGRSVKERDELKFIQDIVKEISSRLNVSTGKSMEDLVGIGPRLEKLRMHIGVGSDDVRMIGIWGMGGIGKTTLARVVYDLISCEFEGSCFLANIREISKKHGLVILQKQLLSSILKGMDVNIFDVYDGVSMMWRLLRHRKILVVLDDVDAEQLNLLAGKRNWFGPGSRIIITTRDKNLLTSHRVDEVYKVEELNDNEAHNLFSLRAFKNNLAPEPYLKLTNHVLRYASGLPLALNVLGSILFDKTVDEWENVLQNVDKHSVKEILDNLQRSLDGLQETEKEIFLHVVCFFKGKNRYYATKILESCGFNATFGLSNLINKSLISILPNNELWVHGLLQQMGQQIVNRESSKKFDKCKRLLKEADVYIVLKKSMGCRLFSVFFLVLEAIVVALDLSGKSEKGFLLVAFLLSGIGFIITLSTCIKKRTTAAFRQQAERQLVLVEVVFSVIQLITTLVQYILAVVEVKKNYNASFFPLAFAIIVLVFAFKEERTTNTRSRFLNIQGCRLFSLCFLVLEAISVVLDLCGKSKRACLLSALLLSTFGLIITIYACVKKRTTAAFRQPAERQLGLVEVVFSAVQLVMTLIQYILAVVGVKKNFNASVFPLAFSVIVVVFAFKQEKMVNTRDRFSNIQLRALQEDEAKFSLPI